MFGVVCIKLLHQTLTFSLLTHNFDTMLSVFSKFYLPIWHVLSDLELFKRASFCERESNNTLTVKESIAADVFFPYVLADQKWALWLFELWSFKSSLILNELWNWWCSHTIFDETVLDPKDKFVHRSAVFGEESMKFIPVADRMRTRSPFLN